MDGVGQLDNIIIMKVKIMFTIFTPLVVTLFLVIFLPTALLIFANPKQQNLYSSYQIKTHGASLQNILYQDQKIVQKLLQDCEDIRNSLITIFLSNSPYQSSNLTLQLANETTSAANVSMYYNSGTDPQAGILQAYSNTELYIRSFVPNTPSITTLVWSFQSGIKFWFPSFPISNDTEYTIPNSIYNQTEANYLTNKSLYTVFSQLNQIQICTPILNQSSFLGVLCMFLNGQDLFDDGLVIVTNEMYSLVLATTTLTPQQLPSIIFSSSRDGNINFPPSNQYVQIDNNNIQSLWLQSAKYKFYLQLTGAYVWYQFPIILTNYQGSQEYVFFLFTNLFIDINQYSIGVGTSYLIEVIVIPISLFFVSVLVSYFILNKMVNTLISEIDLLVKKSQSLLDNDLDIKIPEYTKTLQVRKVYQQFDNFSQVIKYSFKDYFAGGNTTDKNVKYYKALKLYTDLNDKIVIGNIYQNLANICNQQSNLQKAAEYYKSSLESISTVIVTQFAERTNQSTVKDIYQFLYQTKKKIPNESRHLEVTLIRRYYNYIEVSFRIADKNNFCNDENMRSLLKCIEEFTVILKQKKNDPNEIVITILGAEIYLEKGYFDLAEQKLNVAEGLYTKYNEEYEMNDRAGNIPPEILYQYLSLIWGNFSQMENKPLDAFRYYIAAFDGETYEPLVRQKLLINLKKLLVNEYLSSLSIQKSVYFQVKTNDPKQYFIVIDFSLSMATKIKVLDEVHTRTHLAITQALRIFDEHIKSNDRVSFIKFQAGMEQIFNLTEKGKYQRMLRGTIQQMERGQLRDGTAIYNTLKTLLINTKALKKEKILVFIVDGCDNCSNITPEDIQEITRSMESITVLFIYFEMPAEEMTKLCALRNYCQTCYFVNIFAEDDINRILKGKSYERKYPQSYIL